jgi:hypothetical protein
MRRGTSRLVEREQKAESHLVATHKGKARELRKLRRIQIAEPTTNSIRDEQSKLLLDWGRRFTEVTIIRSATR